MDRYHPDKNASNPDASELFKEVAYSYSILSDPERRRQYDNAGFEVLLFPFVLDIYSLFILPCNCYIYFLFRLYSFVHLSTYPPSTVLLILGC